MILAENYDGVSEAAASLMAEAIAAEPDLVVVPATGDTPMGAYARLAALCRERALDTTRLRVFQLDLMPDADQGSERVDRLGRIEQQPAILPGRP